jgi:hypothetical protein
MDDLVGGLVDGLDGVLVGGLVGIWTEGEPFVSGASKNVCGEVQDLAVAKWVIVLIGDCNRKSLLIQVAFL